MEQTKLGCDKNCQKICVRPEEQNEKRKWKKQHRHDGFKLYSKIIKNIVLLEQQSSSQILILKAEVKSNFQMIRNQLLSLQLKMMQQVDKLFMSNEQIHTENLQQNEFSIKIKQFRANNFIKLRCCDVYQIDKHFKNVVQLQFNGQTTQLTKNYRKKQMQIKFKMQDSINQLFKTPQYKNLSNQDIIKTLEESKNLLNNSLNSKLSKQSQINQYSQSSISIDHSVDHNSSNQYSAASSHLSRVQSSRNQSITSHDLPESQKSQISSFMRDLPRHNESMDYSKNESLLFPPQIFKKKTYKEVKQQEKQYEDQELQRIVKHLVDQSRILEPQQVKEDLQEETTANNFEWEPSQYHKFVPADMSEQQQLEQAIRKSEELIVLATQNSSQYLQKNSLTKLSYKNKQNYQQNSSECEPHLMQIAQIHKLSDELYRSKQEFDLSIKVVAILDLSLFITHSGYRRNKMKFLGADNTGCSVFYIDFHPSVKPGVGIRIYNCFLKTFSQETNFEIQSHDRNLQCLQHSVSVGIVPNFQIMMSRLNHIKGKWNYEVKVNKHFKVRQILHFFKRQMMKQMLLRKNVIVVVLKKINKNKLIVGDYSGVIDLNLQDRFYSKSNFQAQQGDTLNIIRAIIQSQMVINQKKFIKEDKCILNTSHPKCLIHNLRNSTLKFHKELINYQ